MVLLRSRKYSKILFKLETRLKPFFICFSFDELKIEIKEEPISLESSEDEISWREKLQNKSEKSQSSIAEAGATDPEKSSCNFCGGFYKRSRLERHRKRHYGAGKEHRCEHCELSFTMMTKLVIHKKNCHGVEMHCETCDKKFQKVYSYTSHLREHKKGKSFVCDVCGFATVRKTALEKHKLIKHHVGEFPFPCKFCKKGFLSNHALSDHVNRHTGATPHQCHRCGSAYSSSKSLERHAYKCHPELFKNKIFPCKACTKVFKSKKKMEAHHANKHPNGRRNVCEVCGKDFSFRESLIRHRRIHTGEKPKECSVCKRRFACANYLQCHMRTHTGEKPYQCRFCWKKFSQRSSMVTHEKSHLKGLESSGLQLAPAPARSEPPP